MEMPKDGETVTREWNVLYTSQIMKKSKTYHDGILRLDVRRNHSKQVVLYDIDRKLLDKKLIKKDQIVECGQSFKFDSHLVDIGEALQSNSSLDGLNIHGNCMKEFTEVPKGRKTITTGLQNSGSKKRSKESDQNVPHSVIKEFKNSMMQKYQALPKNSNSEKKLIREWNVLYTSQIMKKAKTYHDGILTLDVRGNHSNQVILHDIDRKLLDKKLIKNEEIIKCGQSFKFDGHLVEIGEPLETSNSFDGLNSTRRNCMKESVKVPKDGDGVDGPINSDLCASKYKIEGNPNCMKSVRSVSQILTSLKRPTTDMNITVIGVDAITIQHDASLLVDTVEKVVKQEYVPLKSNLETSFETKDGRDDNVELKETNPMESNVRTTAACANDEGIDAMVVIQQTSPTFDLGYED